MAEPTGASGADPERDGRVGFRDIYRAVGESETRIKEHISLVLLPIASTLADHEARIRSIEEKGSAEAQEAMHKAQLIAVGHDALVARVDAHDDRFNAADSASRERRRLGQLSAKTLAAFILVVNFLLGLIVVVSNLLTKNL